MRPIARLFLAGVFVASLCAAGPAAATIFVDIVDGPTVVNVPFSFTFDTNSSNTTFSFSGYDVPAGVDGCS